MIKSINFKNYGCFLEEQSLNIFSSYKYDSKKRINFFFGVPSTGKTSFFELVKTTIYYMRRWYVYNGDNNIIVSRTMEDFYNPNIFTFIKETDNNFTEIEIIFDNDVFTYKYELCFSKNYCKFEKLSYKINDVLDEWIELFDKQLIDYVYINDKIETIFETYVNCDELNIEFTPSFNGINQNNSVLSYIISISNAEIMQDFNKILDKIVFFQASDFLTFKNYNFPSDEIEKNKEYILTTLDKIKIHFDDVKISHQNKIRDNYTIDLYKKINDQTVYINSSRLSKGEIKLFLFSIMLIRYRKKECIIFIDDFSLGIDFDIYFELLKGFEKEAINNTDFQLFTFNNHFFNKTKNYNSRYVNIFDFEKDNNGNCNIKKIANN